MDKIVDFYKAIKEVNKDFTNVNLENIPYYNKQAERTVTFLFSRLDSEGYYKSILPAIALNEFSKSYRCMVADIQPYNPAKHISEYNIIVHEEIIKQSDMLIFPFTTDNIEQAVKQIRKFNPSVKIGYQIDFNYYKMLTYYPHYNKYQSNEAKLIIENNIKIVDRCFFSNELLLEAIHDKVKPKIEGAGTEFFYQPTLITPQKWIDSIPNYKQDKEKKRILIIANESHYYDLNPMKDVLININKKFGDRVEIVVFGWNGNLINHSKDCLKGVDFKFEKPVPLLPIRDDEKSYFHQIALIDPDFAFIPVNKNEFGRTSKNHAKFLEMASMGIPCFISNVPPYDKLIQKNHTAITITDKSEWAFELEMALNADNSKNIEIQKAAFDEVWSKYAIDIPSNIQHLEKLFS
jgi:hypothetical protein